MAKPTITTTTNILDYAQFQTWAFQPAASNSPTSWALSATPPGMSFNTATGRLSGACTTAGFYAANLTATNGDGTSDPLPLSIGILAGMPPAQLAVDVDIDLVTRVATVRGVAAASAANKPTYQHALKFGDDVLYCVRFLKGGVVVEPDIASVMWAIKTELEDPERAKSSGWRKVGFGMDAAWLVHGVLNEDSLRGELAEAEEEGLPEQQVVGHVEFEWLQSNAGGLGPDPLRGSSQAMDVLLAFDYQQNAAIGEG